MDENCLQASLGSMGSGTGRFRLVFTDRELQYPEDRDHVCSSLPFVFPGARPQMQRAVL